MNTYIIHVYTHSLEFLQIYTYIYREGLCETKIQKIVNSQYTTTFASATISLTYIMRGKY